MPSAAMPETVSHDPPLVEEERRIEGTTSSAEEEEEKKRMEEGDEPSSASVVDEFELSDAARRMQVLLETNALLRLLGFGARSFDDYDDLVASVSSMSVALYEKLFQFRLDRIIRVPETPEDYAHNAQVVVDALSGAVLEEAFAIDDLTGRALCDGDVLGIQRLVRMFQQIYDVLYGDQDGDEAETGEEEDHRDDRPEDEQSRRRIASTPSPELPPRRRRPSRSTSTRSAPLTARARPRTTMTTTRTTTKTTTTVVARGATSSSSRAASTDDARRPRTTGPETTKRPSRVVGSSSGSNSAKQSEIRGSRRTAAMTTTMAAASSASVAKKRTRRVASAAGSCHPPASERGRRGAANGNDPLLTTQRYGRYVPLPDHQRASLTSLRHSRQHDGDLGGGDDDDGDFDESHGALSSDADVDLAYARGENYFGNVSSVSGASGSLASVHYMEEEGEFAQNFSTIQSHSSPGTVSKESPESDPTPERSSSTAADGGATAAGDGPVVPPRSRNQEDADPDSDRDRATSSPLKKKVATATTKGSGHRRPKTISPTRKSPAGARSDLKTPNPSLYPLLPETRRRVHESKAQKEFLRYKLQLKDHLQELRHREQCQRKHLERAYRLGEHAANVERIRTRRFEQELRLHRIAIGVAAKEQEERQLRDAMDHMLHLEKERLRDEHRTTTQRMKQIQREHAEREQAMETFYSTQLELVKEQTERELKERQVVERAHRLASEQMIRELRRDGERELSAMLVEKQHLADVRRFRHSTQLSEALDKGNAATARRVDAFYAAAMKARELRQQNPGVAARAGAPSTRTPQTQPRDRGTASNRVHTVYNEDRSHRQRRGLRR